MSVRRVRVRVVGLLFADDQVLIVEHRVGNDRWWCFPGGALEPGETPEQGVAREIREELGLRCDVGPLVAVGTHIDDTNHAVELYFQCTSGDGEPVLREETVVSALFVALTSLRERGVFPLELAADLASEGIGALQAIRYYRRFA